MKRLSLLMISMLVAAGLLAGCGEEEPAPAAPPAVSQPVAAPPPAQAAAPAAEAAPVTEEAKYNYQAEGRRDPFLPLLAQKGRGGSQGREFENPLEAYDLVQYQLKGVIIGFGEPKAMVSAPDGKSYILKVGVRIGKSNGIIRDINRERVLVEEQYQDLTGAIRKNLQEMQVPKREGV